MQRIKLRLVGIMRESPLPAIERAEAGRVLAKLGDPRPEVKTVEGMQFCLVPAGPFRMGQEKEQHLNKVLTYDYWISRYPVTVAQFQAFVDEGGYQVAGYWTEAARDGVRRENKDKRPFDDEPYESSYAFGKPYNPSNHPVVGMTWYEALAFTRWLTERLHNAGLLPAGLAVQLPSEAEWEKVGRGGVEIPTKLVIRPAETGLGPVDAGFLLGSNENPVRVYPWGDNGDPNRANYNQTGIGGTSPVGCFPSGASPYGVEDLSGNVWEWTRSLWGKFNRNPEFRYPYNPKDGRENLEAGVDVLRVLRGGVFSDIEALVRCAFRGGGFPGSWNGGYGFRVVVSPF